MFFSALRRAAADPKAPRAALGAAWAGFLAARPGVKVDEMRWTGLHDFLTERSAEKVTKAEIDAFLVQNAIEVREVVAGGGERLMPDQQERLVNWLEQDPEWDRTQTGRFVEAASRGDAESIGDIEQLGAPDDILDALHSERHTLPTKYGNFTFPGGRHYRELLLTLPDRPPTFDEWMERVKVNSPPRFEAFTADPSRARGAYEGAVRDNVAGDSIGFRSDHFDEVNVVVHVRFNERTSVDGMRVLFVEEMQSDWAQKGRQKGFRHRSGVPPGPFVGSTEKWTELALKRMVRWAAEHGFDRLAWTTGNQQAARYDLSMQVEKIVAVKGAGGFDIWATPRDEREQSIGSGVSPERLAGVVGKELADRIARDGGGEYAGLDLRFGGEGMRVFYDTIVPGVAQRLGKKWGVKVGTTRFAELARLIQPPAPDVTTYIVRDESGSDVLRTTDAHEAAHVRAEVAPGGAIGSERTWSSVVNPRVEETPVHSIDITPEMRRSVVMEGQPLFSVANVAGRTSELSERAARVFPGLPLERIPGGVVLTAPSGHRVIVTARSKIDGDSKVVNERHGAARVAALGRGEARLAGVTVVAGRDVVVDVVDQAVLPHEALHVFLEVFASARERDVLQRYFDTPGRAGGRHWTEVAADAYQRWFDRPDSIPAFVARVFERIRSFLVRAEELLAGPSHRTVFEHLSRGDPFKRLLLQILPDHQR